MSGGGGGGGSRSSSKKAEEPVYPGKGVPQKFAQAMPGQLEALAAQLSAGYGQTPAANMAFLQGMYEPMNIMNFPQPMPKAPLPNTPQPVKPGNPNSPAYKPRGRQLSRGNR
jgi:hypothetical protein